jgi:protein TonB
MTAAASVAAKKSVGQEADSPPQKRHSPPPSYPAAALTNGVEGRVVLRVLVGASGDVERVAIYRSSGSTLLDQAALTAVARWKFEPARRHGEPIEQEVAVPIRFRIDLPLTR